MAIYQHMQLQFRLSPEDDGDFDWFDYHNNLSCNQDELDHARDVWVMKNIFYLNTQYSRQKSAIARATLGFSLGELWSLDWVMKGLDNAD